MALCPLSLSLYCCLQSGLSVIYEVCTNGWHSQVLEQKAVFFTGEPIGIQPISFVFLTKMLVNKWKGWCPILHRYKNSIWKDDNRGRLLKFSTTNMAFSNSGVSAYSHLFKSGVVLTTFANFRGSQRLDLGKLPPTPHTSPHWNCAVCRASRVNTCIGDKVHCTVPVQSRMPL